MDIYRVGSTLVLAATVAAPLAPPAAGQSLWNGRDAGTILALEWAKPNLSNDFGAFTGASSALFASARVPLTPGVTFVADLPLAYGKISEPGFSETSTAIGNPYAGVEYAPGAGPFSVEAGIRLPLASEDEFGSAIGMLADAERMEAFVPKITTVSAIANYTWRFPDGMALRLRAGPALWYDSEADSDYDEDTTEVLLGYGAHGSYDVGAARVDGGISGRAILTESGSFGERSMHQLGLGVSYATGRIRPGVYLRVPLDEDVREVTKTVVGLNVSYRLN